MSHFCEEEPLSGTGVSGGVTLDWGSGTGVSGGVTLVWGLVLVLVEV